MSALVRSELLKVRTTRAWWAYLAVIVLLAGIAAAGEIGSSSRSDRGTLDFQVGLVESAGVAALLAIILGITLVTSEFRHGTITPTFLATPNRERVVAAKGAAATIVALFFAVLALAVIAAVALTWLSLDSAEVHLGDGETIRRAAQTLLAVALWALMGIAIGAIVQSQVAALVGTLVWVFLGETLLSGLLGLIDLDGAAPYLPFQALDAADGTGSPDLLSYGPGIGASLAWVAAIGAAGIVRTNVRDIT